MRPMQRRGSDNAPGNADLESGSVASGVQVHPQTLAATLKPHVAPALETGASVTSIASATSPLYAKQLGVASGASWTAAGLTSLATNKDHDPATYAAGVFNTTAGAAQMAAPLLSGPRQTAAAGVSAGTWGASGAIDMAKAGYDLYKGQGSVAANVANGISGAFNLGGAVASGASTALAGTPAAVPAAIASDSLWLAGAAAQHLGAWAQQRYSVAHQPDDLEANHPETAGSSRPDTPLGHPGSSAANQSTTMPGGMDSLDAG